MICADSHFSIRYTPMLPQWHVKGPGHCEKSRGGNLQPNTHTPYLSQRELTLTRYLSGM